jgi:ADP-ribosylglycohydrolase
MRATRYHRPVADKDAIGGTLLGTAVGDALGLPMEGMRARPIARRFGRVERYHLLGRTGFVSDDTEQTALVAQSLVRARREGSVDVEACERAFRRALLGWFLRLPFGIGLGTLRACLKIAVGARPSGVFTAGNGAAMRAAIVGAALPDDAERRRALGRALAETTHRDPRAVEGALVVAEVAALAAQAPHDHDREALVEAALVVVEDASLRAAIDRARALAREGSDPVAAGEELGTSGFVLHTVPLALFCFVRDGGDPVASARAAILAGGDTDSNAAVAGALAGALGGAGAVDAGLVDALAPGPFGKRHLLALAAALNDEGVSAAPRYSATVALLRNLALYPVVLAHGFRRLLPF